MSGPDVELEERLRGLASAYKDGIEPPDTLHVNVMASTIAPRPPAKGHSMFRELSLAAALIAFVALVAFGFSRLHSLTPGPIRHSPSPSPAARVIPWYPTQATPLKLQSPKTLTAGDAAQDVRQTVTDVTPLLLPSAIPAGLQAQLYDNNAGFSVVYQAADGRKIMFSIVVPNPAPGGANVRQSRPVFRGVRADYQVDDATLPKSHRWLMWNEPGTWLIDQPGVPYFLTTEGFTEAEFWTIANSIGPIPAPATPPAAPPALRVTLAAVPDTLVGGQTLRFTVTITNDSGAPLWSETCPDYEEGFTPGGLESYALNCAPLGRLEAGASATFAMEFTVRPWPKTPTGQQKFMWRLHGAYAGGSASKVVTVSAS
ncbi:MAG: hypothetical protein M3Z28_11485 [Candidatus Dormibacteraeota bacterium]|nr:hypothetical protein [Candidatus Dormibacteraeota bacterium]